MITEKFTDFELKKRPADKDGLLPQDTPEETGDKGGDEWEEPLVEEPGAPELDTEEQDL